MDRLEAIGDPIAPLLTRMEKAADTIASNGRVHLSDAQVDAIGQRLMIGCQGWAYRAVEASYWRSQTLIAALIVLVGVLSFAAGWWANKMPSDLSCGDQSDGSRICWMYVKLPRK